MARPIRLEVAGGLYHVIVRGNERRAVFRDDVDRRRYLGRLAHYREKFSFQLLAYCLLDNHIHLAVETGKWPLSGIMAGCKGAMGVGALSLGDLSSLAVTVAGDWLG